MALSSRNDGCDTRSLLWAEFVCGELVEWTRDTFRQLLSLSYCLFACVCGCVEEGRWTVDRLADQHNWTFRSLSHTPIAIHTHKPAASVVDRQLVSPYLPSHHISRVFTPILCTMHTAVKLSKIQWCRWLLKLSPTDTVLAITSQLYNKHTYKQINKIFYQYPSTAVKKNTKKT